MHSRESFYIGGSWVPPGGDGVIEVIDPTTEQVLGSVPQGNAADVDRAVAAARAAFEPWAATSAEDRAGFLAALSKAVTARTDDFARSITSEMGAPLKVAAKVQTGLPATVLAAFAELLRDFAFEEEIDNSLVVREPVGVVGAITPWNYPLHQAVAKVAPALAAGCTIVLKPSEVAPMTAFLLAEICDEVGLPAGVLNIVTGYGPVVGEAIAAHPDVDMVSFTGSVAAGKRVAAVAAGTVKRVTLELGGKSANVLLPDADFTAAVKVGVGNALLNSGQTCTAWTRLLVPAERHDEVVEAAAQAAAKYTLGNPFDETTRLGPLASADQRDRVRGYIEAGVSEGALLATGGAEPPDGLDTGFFVQPTVFGAVRPEMRVAQEEIFGPVLCVLPYSDTDDALRIANGTIYGLAGGVWSADPDRALAFARRMRTGQVDINGARFNPLAPFGGYKQSGTGRELGRFGLEEFCEIKSVQR
ncbi:MAG: aldehyde dehydrogenase family protein [Mycobacteriales bacterium]